MKKILSKLNDNLTIPIYVIAICSIFSFFQTCSNTSEGKKTRRAVDSLTVSIETLKSSVYSKGEMDLRMNKHGLVISKNILFDWNSIVRTSKRPDDRMNEYDKEIEKIDKELNKKSK
jgi:hypothetical protein